MKSRDWVLGAGGWGKKSRAWGPIVLFTVALTSQMGRAEEMPIITVRLFNYAPVSAERLNEAEKEASLTLHRAGVEIEWLECRITAADVAKPPACQEPLGPAALALRVLPSVKSAPPAFRDSVGFAIVLKEGGPSAYANVFYDRVEELAEGGPYSRALILGHAMAHEIGHLLLGTAEHSARGIMRAKWEREDLRDAARRDLIFDAERANLIRHAVGVRRSVALASQNQR